eukprot:4851687-Prymnesium_polylepis.1
MSDDTGTTAPFGRMFGRNDTQALFYASSGGDITTWKVVKKMLGRAMPLIVLVVETVATTVNLTV